MEFVQPIPFPVFDPGRDLGLIGNSPEINRVVSMVRKIGPSAVNVLVTGESGTGKEMVARALHQSSQRAKKPFVAINCAAIPRELLESELFGHAKGAFTGATVARRGLFEEAHEGTILLDEIGDLPLNLQAKILRLIQTKQVKALGQNTTRDIDVRIVSATHKNLKALIQKGEFREDLYYRLNVMPIHLPALRDRKDDILQLANYFLRRNAESNGLPLKTLSRKAATKLLSLPWKGNVRELENVIERAMVLADADVVTDDEIMAEESEPMYATTEDLFNSGLALRDIEREYIRHVLTRTGNRKEAAVRILGIDRKTLYRKEKLYGIRPEVRELN
jgi:two-component system, NtrC family, response regulator HydG